MKKNALALPFTVGAFLLAAGCGDDVTKTTVVNETTGIAQLAKGDTLPECTKDNAGEMLYVADSGAVYHCTGKAWATLNGADGTDGKDGSDGKDGTDGESCEAVALKDGSGYKILCGEDSIGVVLNGIDGEKGDDGAAGSTGETGADGEGCTVADDGEGTVTVTCAGETVELTKALCAGKPYDPAKSFCFAMGTLDDSVVTRCGGEVYDVWSFFCAKDSVITRLCALDTFDIDLQYCGQDEYGNEVIQSKTFVTTKYLNQTMLENGEYGTLFDERNGMVYRTVTIGSQTWMAQNLNYETAHSACSGLGCDVGGRMYAKDEVSSGNYAFDADICPVGWAIPTKTQWLNFFAAVGWEEAYWDDDAGGLVDGDSALFYKLIASVSEDSWSSAWKSGTDAFGFAAIPAGYVFRTGTKYNENKEAYFISDGRTYSSSRTTLWVLNYTNNNPSQLHEVATWSLNNDNYYSLRCIKSDE